MGGGDGGAVREIAKHPEVEEIHQCEIDEVSLLLTVTVHGEEIMYVSNATTCMVQEFKHSHTLHFLFVVKAATS